MKLFKLSRKSLTRLAVSMACVASGSSAWAQLEEVVVTATKRAESVQDIPMSVEVVSGERLQNMAIRSFADLAVEIPNFFVGDGVVTTNVNMRGMGSGGERAFEQSVGMFIDNIYMPRSRQYRSPFFDAERVEILRGPQAVLFGLNSTAGAVSVHSARSRPGDEFSAEVRAAYETEYEGTTLSFVAGGSLSDSFALRFAGQWLESDGYYENTYTGETEGDREDSLFRVSAVWQPSDNLVVDAKFESVDFDQEGNHGEIYGSFSAALDGGDGQLDWRRHVDAGILSNYPLDTPGSIRGVKPGLFQEVDNIAIKFDYTLNNGSSITGIYGYTDMEYSFALDLDTIAGSLLNPANGAAFVDASIAPETYEQDTFELRLTSQGGQKFDYMAGIYYMDSTLYNNNQSAYDLTTTLDALVAPGFCAAFGLCGLGEFAANAMQVEQSLWSVYAQGTFNISDRLRILAGLRYTDEEKDVQRGGEALGGSCKIFVPSSGAVVAEGIFTCNTFYKGIEGSRSSDNAMPELVVQFDISDSAMIYGKVGTSAKGGGFAMASTIYPEYWEYDDETVVTFEAGYKGSFAGGSGELNAVVFRSEYDDLQVNSFVTEGTNQLGVISNTGKSISQGLELDGRLAVSDWLILGGSLGFLDATFDEFKRGACSQSSGLSGTCDLSGRDMPYSPEFSGTLRADISAPITPAINFIGGVTVSYTDEYYTDGTLDEVAKQDSYSMVSARIGVEAADGRWSLTAIGRNLGEEAVLDVTQPLFGYYLGYIGAPRTVTVQATYRF